MIKWVKNNLVHGDARGVWASLKTYHGGGQLRRAHVPYCYWVRVVNGQWLPRFVLDNINKAFVGADITPLKNAVLITSNRYYYTLRTYHKSRLTTKKKGDGNGPER